MKVLWSEAAGDHVEAIRNFIACDSRRNADRVAERILNRGDGVGFWPEAGSIVPELNRSDVREVFEYSYRIIYQVRQTYVYILAVIHGARKLPPIHGIE
ncbi:MAG: type II toxin-antitoxin system RelE/ParE family toxin [Planctomycetaceae bacterium]